MSGKLICVFIFVALLVVVASAATTENEYREAFDEWVLAHNKVYPSEDFLARYAIFKASYDRAAAHNQPDSLFKQGLNEYADLTWEEFSATRLGYNANAEHRDTPASEKRATLSCASGYATCGSGCCPSGYVCSTSNQCISCGSSYTTCPTGECCPLSYTCDSTGCHGAQVATGAPLTPTVNWTAQGYVTPVKNQGSCGCCWSFSATGALEAAYNIKHNLKGSSQVSLSEQQLIDCSSNSTYGNQGCNGGVTYYAFKYIKAVGGIDSESSYAYKSNQGACAYNSATKVASLTAYATTTTGSETALQTQVAIQPVSVAINAAPSLQAYANGVYNDPACGTGSSAQLNHAVLVVGYGTDATAGAYWIVKNSWGANWGMNGYFLLKKGSNMCGVAQQTAYPTAA